MKFSGSEPFKASEAQCFKLALQLLYCDEALHELKSLHQRIF